MLYRRLRAFPLCLLVCISFLALTHLALAQPSSESNTPSQSPATQVVYVIGSSTITTYNVDPQTLDATQVGSPLNINTSDNISSVVASPNDHAIYVIIPETATSTQLLIYGTDTSGVPQTPALQVINTNSLGQVLLNPKSSFLYAVFQTPLANLEMQYTIESFEVDAQGKISHPQNVATYTLSHDASGEDCGAGLVGFNSAGTVLYDEVGCSTPESYGITYYERNVNLTTGTLGSDVEVISWDNGEDGIDTVEFIGDEVFLFQEPNDFQSGINSVSIYPLVPDTSAPLLNCTASMLESCGYGTGTAHPSGKYIFMSDTQNFTEIDRVELNSKKIVDTGNYIPYSFGPLAISGQFSPDGTIVYATSPVISGSYGIQIYGFNVATSDVTPGGAIGVPELDFFLATQRD
jgi:hypothetical protein